MQSYVRNGRHNILRNGKQMVNSSMGLSERYIQGPIDGDRTGEQLRVTPKNGGLAWYSVNFQSSYKLKEIDLWFHDTPSGQGFKKIKK